MKSNCTRCGKTFNGVPFDASINEKQEVLCNECYLQLKEEYKNKPSCEECVFFDVDTCEYNGELTPVNLSGREYFVQRENCIHFADNADPANRVLKGTVAKKESPDETGMLVEKLAKKGMTITYYCCHCGKPLKIGEFGGAVKECPYCGKDLTVIDMAKLISQYL